MRFSKTFAAAVLLASAVWGGLSLAGVAADRAEGNTNGNGAFAPLVWTDVDGRGYGPVHLKAAPATVFLFFSTNCPLSNAYAARIRALEQEFFARRVRFFLVNALATDSGDAARTWARERGLSMPVVKDTGALLTERLGATRTTEAVVVGRDGMPLYHGPIDDAKDEAKVRAPYLRTALETILAGKAVSRPTVPITEGCLIPREKKSITEGGVPVTYAHDIAPILNRSCVPCHRTGEVAPFPLDTYAQAKLWSGMVAETTRRKIMPPWKAAPGFGDFHDSRSLTDAEIALLKRWDALGAPAGNLKEAPKPPTFTADWRAGQPDLIVRPSHPYNVTAEGRDNYRAFVLPVEFKEDTFVTLAQVKPNNPAIVHHIIVYIDPTGTKCLEADARDPDEGFDSPNAGVGPPVDGASWLVGWAPGNTPTPLPAGVAVKIPKGARLVMEVHYHRNGRPEVDQSTLGMTFARQPVQKIIHLTGLSPKDGLELPPGNARIPVTASMTIPADTTVYDVSPHMHQIGKEMHLWAEKPDGAKEELIWLKDWDFNWQETYRFKKPVSLPKGTVVKLEAVYDNAPTNPRNPNRPPKRITWGEATTDEMCIGFFNWTRDAETLNLTPRPWQETVVVGP